MTQHLKSRPSKPPLTLRKVNQNNLNFRRKQSRLLRKRMADEAILQIATNDMQSEVLRLIPVKSQKTFEQALADAERAKLLTQSVFSRKGGKARKSNALQELIIRIARNNPSITHAQLLPRLATLGGEGTIDSIDSESCLLAGDKRQIHFYDETGKKKASPISGLKDRLSRAKEKLFRANRQMR